MEHADGVWSAGAYVDLLFEGDPYPINFTTNGLCLIMNGWCESPLILTHSGRGDITGWTRTRATGSVAGCSGMYFDALVLGC